MTLVSTEVLLFEMGKNMTQNNIRPVFVLTKISAATLLALSLAACGGSGGGSGMRAPDPTPAPAPGPDIGVPDTGNGGVPGGDNGGGGGGNGGSGGGGSGGGGNPPQTRWSPVAPPNALYTTQTETIGASAAHAAGITGAGVKVGVVDSGVYVKNKALDEKNIPLYRFSTDGTRVQISPDAPLSEQDANPDQHGTTIAEIIGGKATAEFQGGTAPGVELIAGNVRESDGVIWSNTVHDAVAFFSDQGASVVNVSLGGSPGLVPDYQSASLEKAVNNGTLVVFAAGNDGAAQPSSNSLYPVNYRNAQKGILTVTGLSEDAHGQYTNKWADANACGSAAEWCLSAPATAYVLAPTVTEASDSATISGRIGTSNAAAMVSGAAALTKSAFPWMTNDNLRQTLLSTATYLADGSEASGKRYNSTFGWGRVNAEKAVRGPSGFHFGEFHAAVSSGSYIFANDIEGAGSLTKSGPGALTLAGNNTYTGDTSILSGSLHVSGMNASSHFKVGSGGAISGTGSVRQLTNDGAVVASSDGSMTVTGDFTQNESGVLVPTKGSPLLVRGTATLDGRVDYRNYGYVNASESDTVLSAGSLQVNGLFAESPLFLKVDHVASGNDLVANIARVSATEASGMVESSSELSSAAQLDAAFNVADSLHAKKAAGNTLSDDEGRFLSVMSEVQKIDQVDYAKEAAGRLSGNSYALMPAVVMETQRLESAAVNDRMHKLNAEFEVTDGAWASIHHIRNRLQPDGYDTAKTNVTGIQVGYDKRMGDWLLGGYVSYSDADTDFGRLGGSLESEKYGVGAYAKRHFGDAYAQIQGGYQHGKATFDKLSMDGLSISAKPNTNSFHIAAEMGYGFELGSAKLTPFVGLSYESVRLDEVNEAGSVMGMSIGKKTLAETSANLGIRANWSINEWARLGLHYKYDHVLDRKNQDLTARFMSGNAFSIAAPDYDKGRHTLGLTAQAVLGENTTIAASYDNRFSSDSKTHTFFVGLKHAF